jgi:hypothetical protein
LVIDRVDELGKGDITSGETLDIVGGERDFDSVVDLTEKNRSPHVSFRIPQSVKAEKNDLV